MHKKHLSLLLWVFITHLAFAQENGIENLVINPSFETIRSGHTVDRLTSVGAASGWTAPTLSSPQLYGTVNGSVYDPQGALWPFQARSGQHVVGLNVHGGTNKNPKREYLQGSLSKPLEPGKKYYFSFYVHYHCQGANNIGIAFLPNETHVDVVGLLPLKPQSYQKALCKYDKNNIWTLVQDSFIAYQPLQSFIIGNFFHNDSTLTENKRYRHYYAYIDDIAVWEATGAEPIQAFSKEEQQAWVKNQQFVQQLESRSKQQTPVKSAPQDELSIIEMATIPVSKFIAPNIQFDYDSAELDAIAKENLSAVAAYLLEFPDRTLRLSGYASSEGSSVYNQKLAEKRSTAVRDFLLGQNVPASQLSKQDFGEQNPIGDNETATGRQRNRRVELLLEN
jgi:outer membrane protein OmpA-like peptidoglycan-associated protein